MAIAFFLSIQGLDPVKSIGDSGDMESEVTIMDKPEGSRYFVSALVAGGAAGTSVDIALFPLDTMKTRLQSAQGFWKAGGFRGIYSGLASAAVGSAPTAALFFLTYETVKYLGKSQESTNWSSLVVMAAASAGEVGACTLRVPVEVVKQRAQANHTLSSLSILRSTIRTEGYRGLYRGFTTTCLREIPFSFLQFPIWEHLKKSWSRHQGHKVEAWQSSLCGALSGCIAAGITTPLDVAKTRIMLAERESALAKGRMSDALSMVYRERGIRGLFSGVGPRMLWISLGGAIFLGVYEKVRQLVIDLYDEDQPTEMPR